MTRLYERLILLFPQPFLLWSAVTIVEGGMELETRG